MRIALITLPDIEENNPQSFFSKSSPPSRIDRHLKKQGHRVTRFTTSRSKDDPFEISEFIKVNDIEFTIAFGGFNALSAMSLFNGEWALFFSFADGVDHTNSIDSRFKINIAYRAKAIITDDLRTYQMLIKYFWMLNQRIHYIEKAVLPSDYIPFKSFNQLLIPKNANWFLLNCDQKKPSDLLINLFSNWHRSDPQIYLLVTGYEPELARGHQVARAVNRSSGVIEIKEPTFESLCFAIQNCQAFIDTSTHPLESLVTLFSIEIGSLILLKQKKQITTECNDFNKKKGDFIYFENEEDLFNLCQNIDMDAPNNRRMLRQNQILFAGAARECQDYEHLLEKILTLR